MGVYHGRLSNLTRMELTEGERRKIRKEARKEFEELNRYNFPSQRKFDVNEIEPALRRERTDSKEEKVRVLFLIILLGALFATILHFVVEPGILPKAHAEGYSNQTELCAQYLHDSALNGTAAQETLKTICN